MVYAATTLATIQARLRESWESVPFWTDEEATFGINEALRVWNLLTGAWRRRETFALAAGVRWVSLPAPLSFAARVEFNSVPLHYSSTFGLDKGRPQWEIEDVATSGAPSAPYAWAPAGAKIIAIWPALASGSGTLTVDGIRITPALVSSGDFIDINESELQACLGYTLHYVAFKEGGVRWAASQARLQSFYRSAADQNARLLKSAFFRKAMGLDHDRHMRPIRPLEVANGR